MITRKPVAGDRIHWSEWKRPNVYGTVVRVDGNLCWTREDGQDEAQPFIWNFPRDGTMNTIHTIVEVGR